MSSLITDEMVEKAARVYYENLGWDWDDVSGGDRDESHEVNKATILREFRVALEAVEPALEKLLEMQANGAYDRGVADGKAEASSIDPYWAGLE